MGKVAVSGVLCKTAFFYTYFTAKAKEEIVQLMSELTGQKIDESFGMFPPFYTDCGRSIHIGKNVFINAGCKFQDQGGIYIENGVMIGHNAVR